MSRPKKDKIDVGPKNIGLNNPFASLEAEGLPAGAAEPEQVPAKPAGGGAGKPAPGRLGRVVLRRETAHRGGKTVVVVYDFAPHLALAYIEELARRLRKAVGCGGTVRERTIEIQGDQPDKIRALLEEEGFRVAGVR